MKEPTNHPQPDKATPRPWKIQNATRSPGYVFIGNPDFKDSEGKQEKPVCQIVTTIERQRNGADQANAALIVRAVNEHAALRELLACAWRLGEVNKDNFPHRSPEWVYDHPDSPVRIAMNNFLQALDKCGKMAGLVSKHEKKLAAVRKEGGK